MSATARRTPAPPNGEALPGQLLRLFRLVVDRDMEVDVRAFDAGDRYRHAVGVIAWRLRTSWESSGPSGPGVDDNYTSSNVIAIGIASAPTGLERLAKGGDGLRARRSGHPPGIASRGPYGFEHRRTNVE